MENGELQAYYQPQYNPKLGIIGGAEALVRWVKNDGTVITPDKFIPELEEKGQVSIVDWFIAEETCKTIKQLGNKAVRISVNFGREHAKDDTFVEKLDNLIELYGIDKKLFGVEITESDVATDKRMVIEWVQKIETAGYNVSIDDFGCGMSSLSFVKDVPAKILKIDRSFLNDNCQTKRGRLTLESVFYFAKKLDLSTVVEGVETQEQLRFINTCDADYIQGYIFSKPISKSDFLDMCEKEADGKVVKINTIKHDEYKTESYLG
jgi:EAL domain-containing protein (putative c-di-GMP-specific phosphodiesterase class I)